MTEKLSVAIERLRARYPYRSYQSITAELQQRSVASRRNRKKGQPGRPVKSWASGYENY